MMQVEMGHRQDKREAIMKAAEALFAGGRVAEITVEDVARRAGVGKGTIYRYFRDKEDLFFELALSGHAELCALVEATDPGFEEFGQVREVVALASGDGVLSAADHETIARLKQELGLRFCRRCGYCQPCPQNINIISLMTMASLTRRFTRAMLDSWNMGEAVSVAETCTRCGACATRCPYKLNIPEQIRDGIRIYRDFMEKNRN